MIKNTPRVSVIIPTFNRAHVLPRALNSVLNQCYENIEIIVVNDGSTDGTEKLIKEEFPTVKYIKIENRGERSERNVGNLQGKWRLYCLS